MFPEMWGIHRFFFYIDYWYSSIASLYGMFVDFCIEVEIIEREARRHV